MPDEPVPDDAAGLRAANARLRAVRGGEGRGDRGAAAGAGGRLASGIRRLELRLAELERRLEMDSSDSGTPSSKERIGAKEARRARQQSERERRKDRKSGGQPGHQGKGPERDPDPGESEDRGRRRSAGPAGRPWTARRPPGRGGRRSSTWRSSGR